MTIQNKGIEARVILPKLEHEAKSLEPRTEVLGKMSEVRRSKQLAVDFRNTPQV